MSAKRLVLLARAGTARDRTEAAIAEAGADLAAVLDPGSSHEEDVRAARPDAVLVILDAATEQVLDRFEGVLGDPELEVMFEDAEVAARREGWEAARWSRHLKAKLQGHQDVLPRARQAPAVDPGAAQDAGDAADALFREDLESLQQRVDAMADVPRQRSVPARPLGAVVVAAGVGGPDAVRRLLGGLLPGFPRPVVLRQRIEGGQYDKLVRQMQRASKLEVVLAQAGDGLTPGCVHVVPDGLDLQAAPAGLVFAPAQGEPAFADLPAAESALLLLSGADPALVPRALALSLAGGLALGQSPENCFDPAASNALVARGGEAATIDKLPSRLLQRWPA